VGVVHDQAREPEFACAVLAALPKRRGASTPNPGAALGQLTLARSTAPAEEGFIITQARASVSARKENCDSDLKLRDHAR